MAVTTRFSLLRDRRTKIIATIGPATESEDRLRTLVAAGVDIFRLNMSHGDQAAHRAVHDRIVAIRKQTGVDVAVLADLCGPKIRMGVFEGGAMHIAADETVTISTKPGIGGDGVIVSEYAKLASDVEVGDSVLLADGQLELKVEAKSRGKVNCRVIRGGTLRNNQGINLPGVNVSSPSLTDKDIEDAKFALDIDVDFIAMSFVRRAEELTQLRELINAHANSADLVAKIEKPEALTHADEILATADIVMIARGDLGVELPPEQVPGAQRQLIRLAAQAGTPVIVATQMLESMIGNSRPTRAEVTDVAHAVNTGADAVMLSAETAIGDFPLQAVKMMDRIVRQTEAEIWSADEGITSHHAEPPIPVWNVIAETSARMARALAAKAVMVLTRSGKSAQIVATARPAAPIIAMTDSHAVCRRLAINWGVVPVHEPDAQQADPSELARRLATRLELGKPGEYVLLVRGIHGEQVLNLPSVTVVEI